MKVSPKLGWDLFYAYREVYLGGFASIERCSCKSFDTFGDDNNRNARVAIEGSIKFGYWLFFAVKVIRWLDSYICTFPFILV